MSTPRVTVLLTVYNGLPHIRETIESVLDQTYSDFEFVIVDDGSTDDTCQVIDEYDDDRLRWLSLDHVGRGAALNAGLIRARGELVAIIDADDIAHENRLERQVRFFDANPRTDVLGTWFDRWWTGRDETEPVTPSPPVDDILTAFSRSNPIGHSTSMYRLSAAAEVGGYDESLTSCIDYDFFVRLAAAGHQFRMLESKTVTIRKHDSQSFDVEGWKLLRHRLNSSRVRRRAIQAGGGSAIDHLRNIWRTGCELAGWARQQLR
jgi:glycosyltransferase involved in cell wall biosynthesis